MTSSEIVHRLQKTNQRLERLRDFLESQHFAFHYPDEVLPGPDPNSGEVIERIEAEVGRIPEALTQFYRIIGSVNFSGSCEEWDGCDYPDALIVYPAAVAQAELDDFLVQKEDYLSAFGTFRIPIAPDYYHKAGVSGGMWYGVPVPAASEDPPLLEERHGTTFLRYLEIALDWGGFPGLEHAGTHTWPLSGMRRASAEPGASPNGGPAPSSDNSGAAGGAPSVS